MIGKCIMLIMIVYILWRYEIMLLKIKVVVDNCEKNKYILIG